ncbi:MAG: PQQ-binding-like beta-propeller repeat protein [Acidobacteria bacterium]|nr:PQQ-binding-like beta-propeller repeat protein [Acidobacteriota bacterium]
MSRQRIRCAAVVASACARAIPAAGQELDRTMVEWPYVGSDQAASKYSALADIDASNVERLEVAWTWEPNELPNREFQTRPGSFEVMPLMIDNIVYVSTMYSRVVALDAETGEELWAFDPEAWRTGPRGGPPGGFKHRGVAVWPAEGNRTVGAGDGMRVFINSRDSLYALNAADGSLITSFGDDGRVLLTENFPNPVTHEMFDQTSPPVVFEDLVIVGSRVPDRIQRRFDTPGSVQRSTSTPASGAGSSTRCRSRTMRSGPTPGRAAPGASPGTPTSGG